MRRCQVPDGECTGESRRCRSRTPPTGRCVKLVISATLLCNLLHNRVCHS
jgi:hypothetical protein